MILTVPPRVYSSGRQSASVTRVLQSVSTRLVAGIISQQVITAQPDFSSQSSDVSEWRLYWVWVLCEVSSVLRSDCSLWCTAEVASLIYSPAVWATLKFTEEKRLREHFYITSIPIIMDGVYFCTFFLSILPSFLFMLWHTRTLIVLIAVTNST